MCNTKVLLTLAALFSASLAQTTANPECTSLLDGILARGHTVPPAIAPFLNTADTGVPGDDGSFEDLLRNPDVYASRICAAAGQLPSSLLPEFATWGSAILEFASGEISNYDAAVTQCVTMSPVAASITNYIHSIVSQPDRLCQLTGTASMTAQPKATV
ncbi:hypothetical protein RRF57_008996 [Xylaria bambusicola]|uniref:Uncharacterized protein n=1 Tax=Xylaria bambusicola TaxID=326684 RepID=A0AAN7UQ89_9PEZI